VLTKLIVRNFKRFDSAEIELGQAVVFVGPNNSGKTSALQALALWELGLRRYLEKRKDAKIPSKRPGVTLNRRELVSLPVPDTNLLWRRARHQDTRRDEHGKARTTKIRVEIVVEGVNDGREWQCGFEFDHANEESILCRPVARGDASSAERMEIPDEARGVRIAFLPPMSGLAANELRIDQGAIQVRIGEGRTAEVLRNLCLKSASDKAGWQVLVERIRALFGVELSEPEYLPERGEIAMSYRERDGALLDLSAAGRGLQQTLLLLAYMQNNPGAVLLLDEPDAHLEILRQRQTYGMLTEIAASRGSQIIAASHSEVVLNEAAERDVVVAFLGRPHRIDDRVAQLRKSLTHLGYESYYQAEQTGWVLYLEGSTDLAVLQSFARMLEHQAAYVLERPFVHYVANQIAPAKDHFFGLREAKSDLVGVALLDHQDKPLGDAAALRVLTWRRREIENYLCAPEVLEAYAAQLAEDRAEGPLFALTERVRLVGAMRAAIADFVPPVAMKDRSDPWWTTTKASDDFLDRVFAVFFKAIGIPNLMPKTNYHVLARLVPKAGIDPEVVEMLDAIVEVAKQARPRGEEGRE
jgi:hypothetical protein